MGNRADLLQQPGPRSRMKHRRPLGRDLRPRRQQNYTASAHQSQMSEEEYGPDHRPFQRIGGAKPCLASDTQLLQSQEKGFKHSRCKVLVTALGKYVISVCMTAIGHQAEPI